MGFCGNCGNQIDGDLKFCPSCGHPVDAQASSQNIQEPQIQVQSQIRNQNFSYQPPVMPGTPTSDEIRDAQDNKALAIIAYILFFIPLLIGAHNTSAFVRYHTNQGTVLFIASVVWGIAFSVLAPILLFIPILGWVLMILIALCGFLFLILCVIGIINAANGKMKPLPIIGRITLIK